MFAQVLGSLRISPHGRNVYHIAWPQRDRAGRQIPAGGYGAQIVFLGRGASGGPLVLPPLTFAVRRP